MKLKSKKIKDERLLQLNNKIHSEGFFIVVFITLISIFIKSYVLNTHYTQYLFELGILVVSIAYVTIRSMFLGFNIMDYSKFRKRLAVFIILILSLSISLINGIRNYSLYMNMYTGVLDGHFISVLAIMFISSFIFISVIFMLLYWSNIISQQRIENKLKENEEQD